MVLTGEGKKKLQDFFRQRKRGYPGLYFGSQMKGKPSSLSDIDIAVYLDKSLDKAERFDMRLRLITRVCGVLGSKKVELG